MVLVHKGFIRFTYQTVLVSIYQPKKISPESLVAAIKKKKRKKRACAAAAEFSNFVAMIEKKLTLQRGGGLLDEDIVA